MKERRGGLAPLVNVVKECLSYRLLHSGHRFKLWNGLDAKLRKVTEPKEVTLCPPNGGAIGMNGRYVVDIAIDGSTLSIVYKHDLQPQWIINDLQTGPDNPWPAQMNVPITVPGRIRAMTLEETAYDPNTPQFRLLLEALSKKENPRIYLLVHHERWNDDGSN